ncbi:TatD family hydrolase [Thermithiobacillus plumbiphilus]|uniref:TatD family hydrolase n=1 Tax=Thermithiobacillus plumbiphilus TaxID=1729899 RepID=A0ABU9D9H2_9PROT
MRLFDSHAHFDDDSFDADRPAALARAREAGVIAQLVPAISARLWPRLREVCNADEHLYPAYGLHPVYLPEHQPAHLDALGDWLASESAVAVGEIGLDHYLPELDRDRQKYYFAAQLGIARDLHLPVVVHARHAVEDVYLTLRRFPGVTGVIHSFAGSEEQARRLMDLGFCFGFGGPLTYPGAHRLHRLVKSLPQDRLLLETDSPDQPDAGHRGCRNEPAYLPAVLAALAQWREADPAELAEATFRNTLKLFHLDDLYESSLCPH